MLQASTNKMYEVLDSDDTVPSDEADSDEGAISGPAAHEPVQMILSDRGFLYYVTKRDGRLCLRRMFRSSSPVQFCRAIRTIPRAANCTG